VTNEKNEILEKKPSLDVAQTLTNYFSHLWIFGEFSAGCYLFTVSNSGLLFSHGACIVGCPSSLLLFNQSTAHIVKKKYFYPVTLTFDLDSIKTNIGQRSLRSSYCCNTETHTHARALDRLLYLNHNTGR